jgi:hypothetical protein
MGLLAGLILGRHDMALAPRGQRLDYDKDRDTLSKIVAGGVQTPSNTKINELNDLSIVVFF